MVQLSDMHWLKPAKNVPHLYVTAHENKVNARLSGQERSGLLDEGVSESLSVPALSGLTCGRRYRHIRPPLRMESDTGRVCAADREKALMSEGPIQTEHDLTTDSTSSRLTSFGLPTGMYQRPPVCRTAGDIKALCAVQLLHR